MLVDALFDVSQEILEKIKNDIGEDEQRLSHLENLVEEWIQSESHLPKNYDKKMVRNFIRGSKFSLDTIKRKLEGYFLVKWAFPEFYKNRDPLDPDISRMFKLLNIVRLPKLTENGERICVLSLAEYDPALFDMKAAVKLFWMLYDLTLTCEFPVKSEIFIFDCANTTPMHIVKFLCVPFRNAISILRDAYAARICDIHVVNCSAIVEKALVNVRTLLHKKVKQRLVVHRNVDSLLQELRPEVLPSDFGGALKSLRCYMNLWEEVLVDNSDWFRAQEHVTITGKPSKRIEKFRDTPLEGSFRQLNID